MVNRYLVYSGAGVYSPGVTPQGIVWQRNTDGDPLVRPQADNILAVGKWSEIIRVELANKGTK